MKATGWAVVGPDGDIHSFKETPDIAIYAVVVKRGIHWGVLSHREGYRCVPVTIEGRE